MHREGGCRTAACVAVATSILSGAIIARLASSRPIPRSGIAEAP